MSIPHGLLGKAYRETFAALVVIAVLIAAIFIAPLWIIVIVSALLVFCFWLAYGSPNGGRWPRRS